jgi:hypothetical protein
MSDIISFGTGGVILIPRRDANGELVAVPTPVQMQSCMDFTIDVKSDVKMLEGQMQYALAAAVGKRTVDVSFTHNIHSPSSMNAQGAETVTAGQKKIYTEATPFTIPSTPFTDTVTPPSSGVFVSDLGVYYGDTGGVDAGVQLVRVASSPVAGQYAVSNIGLYTFAAADTGKPVYRKYLYSLATGKSFTMNNRVQGMSPEYSAIITSGSYRGVTVTFEFPMVVIKDQSLPFKNGDFMASKVSLSVMANPVTNVVGTQYFSL